MKVLAALLLLAVSASAEPMIVSSAKLRPATMADERAAYARQMQLCRKLAAAGVPDAHIQRIGGNVRIPWPSTEWRQLYRQYHGREWHVGADRDAEQWRSSMELQRWWNTRRRLAH